MDFAGLDNGIPLEDVFTGPGALYVQTFVHSPVARPRCWFGAPASCPVRMWVNGEYLTQCAEYRPFRPNYGGTGIHGQAYDRVSMREGWNEILLKFVRHADAPPFISHLLLCLDHWHTGLTDVGRTRFPWD